MTRPLEDRIDDRRQDAAEAAPPARCPECGRSPCPECSGCGCTGHAEECPEHPHAPELP